MNNYDHLPEVCKKCHQLVCAEFAFDKYAGYCCPHLPAKNKAETEKRKRAVTVEYEKQQVGFGRWYTRR
jgi:hypothetical protein